MAAKGSDRVSQQPTIDVAKAVAFVSQGATLTKLGTNGRKYKRHFYVDLNIMALCHSAAASCCKSAGGTVRIWVPIRDISDVVKVEDGQRRGPSMFSLSVPTEKTAVKTLIAASRELRDSWVDGLRCVIGAHRSAHDPVKRERMWLEESFSNADSKGQGQLDRDEVTRCNVMAMGKMRACGDAGFCGLLV